MEGMKRGGGHPSRNDLERFVRGDLPREEESGIVRHLLTGCADCVQVTRRLWSLAEWPPGTARDLLRLASLVRGRAGRSEPGLI
jgi:hypothetical protein